MKAQPCVVKPENTTRPRLRRSRSSSNRDDDDGTGAAPLLPTTATTTAPTIRGGAGISPLSKSRNGVRKPRSLRRRQNWRFRVRSCMRCLRRNDRFIPFGATVLLTIVSVTAFLSAIFWPAPNGSSSDGLVSSSYQGSRPEQITLNTDVSVVVPLDRTTIRQSSSAMFHIPVESINPTTEEDLGGLEIKALSVGVTRRTIQPHDLADELGYQELKFNADDETDDVETLYAFDDDVNRNPYNDYDDDNIHNEKHCRRTNWYRDLPINCNNLHEFDVQYRFLSGDTKYLGEGAFREVYLTELPTETLIFKAYVWDSDFLTEDFEWMRFDAIVAEKLSAWRDKIVAIYGFCGTAMINEAMQNGDIEKRVSPYGHRYTYKVKEKEKGRLIVKNFLSGTQKLVYGLEMAEAIAVLHAYPGGVIVHSDIKLAQFLLTDDGHVKLNDFNRAEIMLFNEKDKEYCPYITGIGGGVWRAPEEYAGRPLDEKIDVWSMGNNLYALLTGLKPHYTVKSEKKFIELLENGVMPFIDPRFRDRSFGESKLVDIIPLCWAHDPADRIDIFEVIRLLREAVKENEAYLASRPQGEPRSS